MTKGERKGLVAALSVVAVIVLLAAAYGIFCLIIEDDKIWADASNGVNIQGMSKKKAAQTVEQKFEEDYKDTAVTVELDGQQYTMNVFQCWGWMLPEIEKAYEKAMEIFWFAVWSGSR